MAGAAKVKKTAKMSKTELQKHLGNEPKWDTERALKFENAEFEHFLAESLRHYNTNSSAKELKSLVVEWVQTNMKLTEEELAFYVQSDADQTPMSLCGLIAATRAGMPLREKNKQYVVETIGKIIDIQKNKKVKAEKKEKPVVNIQDRLAEKTSGIIGEIEFEVDNAYTDKPTANIYELVTAKNLMHTHISKVKDHFQRQINEISLLVEGKDDQLNEAYSFLKNKDIKRIGAFYVKLMEDLDSYSSVKKASKKLQVKRPQNKDKLVSKVNYLKESKELKIVSVPPTEILGAQAVWLYHTKHKKLGKYVADDHSALGIKGTSIIGFNEAKSTQKTLRKPSEQLASFMKASKVELRTFLKDIKAVETKLNGRMNADLLILKVEK